MNKIIKTKFQFDTFQVNALVQVNYDIEYGYGADADGNRGQDEAFISELEITELDITGNPDAETLELIKIEVISEAEHILETQGL